MEAQAIVWKPSSWARASATETTRSLKECVGLAVSFLTQTSREAEPRREAVRLHERGPARGQRRAGGALQGQEVRVAPQRVRARLDAALELLRARGQRRVGDLERTEAAITDVPRLEGIGGLALLALQGICRHVVKPPPGSRRWRRVPESVPFTASPRPSSWGLIGIATVSTADSGMVGGGSQGQSLPPLDALLLCAAEAYRKISRTMTATDDPLSPAYAQPAQAQDRSSQRALARAVGPCPA